MPLTAGQIAAFFGHDDQMGLTGETVNKITEEGINSPEDLADFDKDTLKQVAENLRKPGGRIPNPDPNAPAGSTIERPPFPFGAKSQKRLLEAGELIRFYNVVGRQLTPGNIGYDPVIKDFTEQWKALEQQKKEEDPEVPNDKIQSRTGNLQSAQLASTKEVNEELTPGQMQSHNKSSSSSVNENFTSPRRQPTGVARLVV